MTTRLINVVARKVRRGIFGYAPCRYLSDEILKDIFLFTDEFTRDEWDQRLETEQEIIYLGLHLSHVSPQWRRVALKMPTLWAGLRICQSEPPMASPFTLPRSTRRFLRHFLQYSSPLLIYLTLSAENHLILTCLPTQRVRSLVIYGTAEAIYDASQRCTTQFSALQDLIIQISPPPPPPIGHLGHMIPIVGDNFFDFFPSMTWLTLRNVYSFPHFWRIPALRRLTWTMDPQCELDSFSFSFYTLTDIRYLELDVPNLKGSPFGIATRMEDVVFKNAGSTIMNALNRAIPPNLTSLTITSFENITLKLLGFLDGWRGERIQTLSLSLIDITSIIWYQVLRRVPNVKTLELGLTPTVHVPDPFTELMDALAVHQNDVILVPRLSELCLAGDVLSGIVRVVDFLRVRALEHKLAVTQEIDQVETNELAVTQEIDQVKTLVLPTGYFTQIPEWLAWELRNWVVVKADAALNHLVEPVALVYHDFY